MAAIVFDLEPEIWLSHDAGDVLLALRGRGWRTALLTNGIPSAQAAKVRAFGLHDLVDHVIYADEHAPGGKPAGRGDRPQHDGGADAVVLQLTTVPRLALELVQHRVAHAA